MGSKTRVGVDVHADPGLLLETTSTTTAAAATVINRCEQVEEHDLVFVLQESKNSEDYLYKLMLELLWDNCALNSSSLCHCC